MARRTSLFAVIALIVSLLAFFAAPAFAHHRDGHDNGGGSAKVSDHDGDADSTEGQTTEANDGDADDATDPNVDEDDNAHPSGKDRSEENGGSGNQGNSESNPDDSKGPRRYEGELGDDKPGGPGGTDLSDQDGNNGCGNDDDFDDDNNGWCGKPDETEDEVAGEQAVCVEGAMDRSCDKEEAVAGEVIETCVVTDMTDTQACTKPVEVPTGAEVQVMGAVQSAGPKVLGLQINRGAPRASQAPAVAAATQERGGVLPFTGSGMVAFVLVAAGLVLTGTLLTRLRAES